MKNSIASFIAGIVSMGILDYVWLAHIAKNFYLENLKNHITVINNSLQVNLAAAFVVYIVGILSLYFFVVTKASSLLEAGMRGALLGFFMYAFYDFTNKATMHSFPWKVVFVDSIWGSFILGVVALCMFSVYTKV